MALKYKEGDKVRIKSLDWYNKNKDEDGDVPCGDYDFVEGMSVFCGKILTIDIDFEDGTYLMKEDSHGYVWTDEMIEELVEEEMKSEDGLLDEYEELTDRAFKGGYEKCKSDIELNGFQLPEGYQFVDENGNVINATKIILEKKKKEYPKTYEECEKVLRYDSHRLDNMGVTVRGYKWELIRAFQILLICRDAYWKIAGEEMGLGKPWEPDWSDDNAKYSIYTIKGVLTKAISCYDCAIFAFPTEEMRDAFYENFKEVIESCKELL